MLLGQMCWLKYKTKTSEPVWECFCLILQKSVLFKSICLPMLTIPNHCHLCVVHCMKCFFIRNRMSHWVLIQMFFETILVNVLHKTALTYHLIRITNPFFWIPGCIADCLNHFLFGFSLLKQQCCKFFRKFTNKHWKKNSLAYTTEDTPNLVIHYHKTNVFFIWISMLFNCLISWNHFVMVLSNLLSRQRMSRLNF